MSTRKNKERLTAPAVEPTQPPTPPIDQSELPPTPPEFQQPPALAFVAPTEFVEIPSGGRFYPPEHPLHNTDTVEIRHMTAKDEDILASSALLKKGIAIDRFLQNIIVDKRVKVSELLSGDKNALIVASRVTGYGPVYDTRISCPACGSRDSHSFDLSTLELYSGEAVKEKYPDVEITSNKTFITTLPKSQFTVEIRLLNSADEAKLVSQAAMRKKSNLPESSFTNQLKMFIVSINEQQERSVIFQAVDNLPAVDSRYLRNLYNAATPNVDLGHDFSCLECGFEDRLEVPFTSDFFWPKQ